MALNPQFHKDGPGLTAGTGPAGGPPPRKAPVPGYRGSPEITREDRMMELKRTQLSMSQSSKVMAKGRVGMTKEQDERDKEANRSSNRAACEAAKSRTKIWRQENNPLKRAIESGFAVYQGKSAALEAEKKLDQGFPEIKDMQDDIGDAGEQVEMSDGRETHAMDSPEPQQSAPASQAESRGLPEGAASIDMPRTEEAHGRPLPDARVAGMASSPDIQVEASELVH